VTVAGHVKAHTIVLATHTPLGINLLQAEMVAYREYGIAAPLQGKSPPPAIYWLMDEFHSVRRYRQGNNDYLVVVDAKHETGHGEKGEGYYDSLKQYAQEKFGAESFAFQWSAQQYRSADGLPYIGKSGHGNVYVATGFAADGLVWGQAAAEIICDSILGHESPAGELLNPRRFTPLKSFPTWTKMNATAARHLVIARLKKDKFDPDNLRPGEGKVFDFEGHKRAVYRSPDNSLIALSPTCPHLKCIVHWNAADATWDCPCHGSRFSPYGSVIEGPALAPLEQVELPGSQEQ
jgi:Rieske Fe-S protein